jgi:multiple sugar transport system permease protein
VISLFRPRLSLKPNMLSRVAVTGIMALITVASVFPFVWMLSTSFKFEVDVMNFPIRLIPERFNPDNYNNDVVSSINYGKNL